MFGFTKQTETNAKQILFRFVSVRTEIYFCLFRGHPTCDLPGVPDVPVNVLLGRAIDVEIMVNHRQACPDSGLLRSEEGVLWQVHIVYVVELLVLACVKVLCHVVEVLQAAVLIATECQHQLLVRQ